ncbi:MAG: HEAT repeat domain-containing protein [Isosphaeraceae bacterium]
MPERRRARLWIAGIAGGIAIVAAVSFGFLMRSRGPAPAPATSAAVTGDAPWSVVNKGLRGSDTQALSVLMQRVDSKAGQTRTALSDEEGAQWLETLAALRTGLSKFTPPARATTAMLACRIIDKFSPEPAPAHWIDALQPVHDILTASMEDEESNVRYIALGEVGKLWRFIPGRSLTPAEEDALGAWKEHLYRPVLRCLAGNDLRSRIGAISCLGYLAIDSAAAPAVAYVDSDNVDVRRQTLVSFARRPRLLTEDMLLRRLHDTDPSIRDTVAVVLKARGLNQELITLGGLMVHPKPDQRASVINLIKDRTDIDPVVWLLRLSHDTDETVRIQAATALAHCKNPTVAVKRRLAEMARSDGSDRVRQAASKFVPSAEETTASLPPLPGSPSLNPKAN